jgi:hypothetical protein
MKPEKIIVGSSRNFCVGEKLWVRLYDENNLRTDCFPATAIGVNSHGKLTWVQVHTHHRGEVMVARSDLYITQNPNVSLSL